MILTTHTSVAMQCPKCGELEFHALSLFAFSGKGRESLYCRCGESLMSVASRDHKNFNVSFNCAFCGKVHYLRLKRRAFWGKNAIPLLCPEVEASTGFVGPKQKVAQACQEREKSIAELASELGYEDEFENPEVMLKLLDHLHNLARDGALGCKCGNHNLTFELLPDRIELYCEICDAVGVIYGENTENIRIFEGMTSVNLDENKTVLLNCTQHGHFCKVIEEE
ncbi:MULTISPECIES: hypothetical protein [Desulfitobacterium]|uniref:Uncharacterized protein n=2 Tax=Desulfitobacterium dehalogenans TaxID=36854 RepID=I4AEM8_DESDJ|nr:hypothetical protein [Desulfitobacterium sp. PCE1]AFM02413.1 hypothetical protein Desde_4152 [Desulfitobacterium dehalogenans ATCC 51507]HHY25158.1 hypothetical protein [Desulfitobacterium dehalogenans]